MTQHPLEDRAQSREDFERIKRYSTGAAAAAWRRAVLACTGSLPTWAGSTYKRRSQDTVDRGSAGYPRP